MEAHHPHHITHKKKWTEYLLEFFMLFFAVFLGFVAENIREHSVERSRAKELVQSFATDLKKDVSLLNWLENFRENIRKPRLDSFYALLNTAAEKIDKATFYGLLFRIAEFYTFSQATGTINQLKNAGYLRYFSDPQLLNHISEYEFVVQDFKNDENMEFNLHYNRLISLLKQNANNDDTYSFYIHNNIPTGSGIKLIKPDVLDIIKALLIEVMWYNQVDMKEQNEKVKKKAENILNYLHNKYHT